MQTYPLLAPNSLTGLLLRAAFLSGAPAREAWQAWRVRADLDGRLDAESFRLLPPLARNLVKLGVSDPLVDKLKGVARQSWYKNQLALTRLTPLIGQLQRSGVPVLLLQGASFSVQYHQDYVVTPTTPLTLLVHRPDVAVALGQLEKRGWTPACRLPRGSLAPFLAVGNSLPLKDAEHNGLLLQWQLLPRASPSLNDAEFWNAAHPQAVGDVSACVLDPADELLFICAQDAPFYVASPLHRVIDAVLLLSAQPKIDWPRLIRLAARSNLYGDVLDILAFARETLEANIPPAVLRELEQLPRLPGARLAHLLANHSDWQLAKGSQLWSYYWRSSADRSSLHKLARFPSFLKHYWRLDHLWQILRR